MTHEEMIKKARSAKSAEELLTLAKENDFEMTEESAKAYFEQMHKSGELADEELDNVSGGTCYHNGEPVVTVGTVCCDFYCCRYCGEGPETTVLGSHACWAGPLLTTVSCCGECVSCKKKDGLWVCTNFQRKEDYKA